MGQVKATDEHMRRREPEQYAGLLQELLTLFGQSNSDIHGQVVPWARRLANRLREQAGVSSYRDALGEVYVCPSNGHLAWVTRPGPISALAVDAPPYDQPAPAPDFCEEHGRRLCRLPEAEMVALRRVARMIEAEAVRIFIREDEQGWQATIRDPQGSRQGQGSSPAAAVEAAQQE